MVPYQANPVRQTTIPPHSLPKHFVSRCFLLLVLFFFCSKASAVRFDVFVGFNGIVPEGNWIPVACEIQNDGPPFSGTIEISSSMSRGQARRIPLELSVGATKRVIVPIFSSSRYSTWTARLVNERGKTIAEQNLGHEYVKNLGYNTPFITSLSRTVAGAPVLPQAKNRNQPEQMPVVARLQAVLFPDNPIALEGMSTLYLNSESALDLKMPQVQALLAWIDGGGHLIVCAENTTDVNALTWLKNLLPCDLGSTLSVKPGNKFDAIVHDGFGSAIAGKQNKRESSDSIGGFESDAKFANASLSIIDSTVRDGIVLLSADGKPLVVQKHMGRGRVTVLTFSAEREPFLSWKNRDWFWARLADIPVKHFETTDFSYYAGPSIDSVFGAMVDSKQVRKLPLTWLLVLLLIYLIVIGPFDHWWLKKINRPMLTWITFPTYVICFSGLIYFIGFKLRAGDSEWNEIHVVDVLPQTQSDKTVLRGRTFASIYSPSNARYAIASDQPFATFRGEFMANNYGRGKETSEADVIQRGNAFAAEISVPVWTSQMCVSDWLDAAENPLTVEISRAGSKIQVTVANTLDHSLKDLHLVFQGRVYTIGELAKGEKLFTFEVNQGVALRDFVRSHGNNFRTAVQQRQNTFGDNRVTIANIPLSTMAASFFSQLNEQSNSYENFVAPDGFDLSRWADDGYTILLAWDPDHSFVKPINRFSPRRQHRDTLLRVIIPGNS